MRATTELRCYGWSWVVAGAAILAAGAVAGTLAGLRPITVVAASNVLVISVACMLGALVLGQRSGPQVLYGRIFDRAPPAPAEVLVEAPGRTVSRTIAPAALGALAALVVAPLVTGGALMVVGIPRDELLDQLGSSLLVACGWMLVAGAVALRVAAYFRHWEERRDRAILCLPMRAGVMRPVYLAAVPGGGLGGGAELRPTGLRD